MIDILIGILTNIFWVLIGIISTLIYKFIFNILPARQLWCLHDHNNLIVCVATSARTDAGPYTKLATGLGQLRALDLIVTSLNRAYRGIKIRDIFLSDDHIHNKIENDIILLGGPKNNRHTRRLLNKLNEPNAPSIVDQIDETIYWKSGNGIEEFVPEIQDGEVVRDYGLVIRMGNPFSPSPNMLYLFSGGHTYGPIAGARYFTEVVYQKNKLPTKGIRNFAALVSCDVVDKYPVALKLERYHEF